MFSLSPIKIVFLVALVLIILGPDKLPEVTRQVGAAWRKLKELQQKIETEVRDVVPDLPKSADLLRMARSPINILNQLAERVVTLDPDDPEQSAGSTAAGTRDEHAASMEFSDADDELHDDISHNPDVTKQPANTPFGVHEPDADPALN